MGGLLSRICDCRCCRRLDVVLLRCCGHAHLGYHLSKFCDITLDGVDRGLLMNKLPMQIQHFARQAVANRLFFLCLYVSCFQQRRFFFGGDGAVLRARAAVAHSLLRHGHVLAGGDLPDDGRRERIRDFTSESK